MTDPNVPSPDLRTVPPHLVKQLKHLRPHRPVKIMEVCGTHTVAIHRYGIRHLLPDGVKLVSGPGCPVCVSPREYIDEAVFLARQGLRIATFGDLVRVPGTTSSLEKERAAGHHIHMVYSPSDALRIAQTPGPDVVFLAVGFETTIPGTAVTAMQTLQKNIGHFFFLTANRIIPPAMTALLSGGPELDGFILPGHVSTILGRTGYAFLEQHHLPGVISGFEPTDIITSIIRLLALINDNRGTVINNYKRAVSEEGNPRARSFMDRVFEKTAAQWRGIGTIEGSGLTLKNEFRSLDIRHRVDLKAAINSDADHHTDHCRCGDVLRGRIDPPQCPLFRTACRPESPLGPCMVSSEGSCGAWYKYGSEKGLTT